MSQTAIANPSPIDEKILQLGVAPFVSRVRNVAAEQRRALPGLEWKNPLTQVGAEEQPQAIFHFHPAGNLINDLSVMSKVQVQARMGQSQPREHLTDVSKFRARGTKESSANRSIKEQVANLDPRAGRAIPGPHR